MLRLTKISTALVSQSQKKGQRFFIIFGAPGVGKGTYAKMIVKDF